MICEPRFARSPAGTAATVIRLYPGVVVVGVISWWVRFWWGRRVLNPVHDTQPYAVGATFLHRTDNISILTKMSISVRWRGHAD